MHTTILPTKEFGDVVIHHNSDWSGDARVTWNDPTYKKLRQADIPGRLLLWVGQDAAKREIQQQINAVLDGAVLSKLAQEGPSYNHTRADGVYDPCPECLEKMPEGDLRRYAKSLRTEVQELREKDET